MKVLKFENSSYVHMYSIMCPVVFSMLSVGRIVISDLVIPNFFMHSLPTLLGCTIFYTEGVSYAAGVFIRVVCTRMKISKI